MRLWRRLLWLGIRVNRPLPAHAREAVTTASRASGKWLLLLLAAWLTLSTTGTVISARHVHIGLWGMPPDTYEDVFQDIADGEGTHYALAAAVAVFMATTFAIAAAFVCRRLRILSLLRNRDRCQKCGHGIAGLLVSASGAVTCPECTTLTLAVTEWNEVAIDGRHSYVPAQGLATPLWTRARLIRTASAAALLGAVTVLGIASWWTAREVRIRREASVARSERIDPERINRLVRAESTTDLPARSSAVDIIAAAASQYETLWDQFELAITAEQPAQANTEFDPSYLYGQPGQFDDASNNRALALRFMSLLKDNGLYDTIDQLPTAHVQPRDFRPVDAPGAPPPRDLSTKSSLSRVCAARAQLAVDNNNLPEFVAAMNAMETLRRSAAADGMLINWLVSERIRQVMLGRLDATLISHQESEWQNAIRQVVGEMREVPAGNIIQAERLATLDTVAWYFSDASRVRRGPDADELHQHFGLFKYVDDEVHSKPLRLGTYSENRDAINSLYDTFAIYANLDPWERRLAGVEAPPETNLAVANSYSSILYFPAKSMVTTNLRLRAIITQLALNEYHRTNGEFPHDLESLVPAHLASLPADPFSGRPLCYRRRADEFDLWSVGMDGEDNGGTTSAYGPLEAMNYSGAGFDVLLTHSAWREQ